MKVRAYLEREAGVALEILSSEKDELELRILRKLFKDEGISLKDLRRCHRDLDDSLTTLERYAQGLRNPPFWGDLGVGSDKSMPVRYDAKGPIFAAAAHLKTALHAAYVNLILAFLESTDVEISIDQVATRADPELRGRYAEFYRLRSRPDVWQPALAMLQNHGASLAAETLSPADGLREQLCMDSLEITELFLDIDEEYGIDLCDDIGGMDLTVGNLARVLEGRLPPAP